MIKYLPLEVLATDSQSINQYIPSELCDINICPQIYNTSTDQFRDVSECLMFEEHHTRCK